MINITRFQLWSALLACVFALLFAAPNVLPEKTAKSLPSYVPHQQFSLGLDLQGGAYLLLEAEMKSVEADALKTVRDALRKSLRDQRVRYEELRYVPRGVAFRAVDAAQIDAARTVSETVARDQDTGAGGVFGQRQRLYDVRVEGNAVTVRLTDAGLASLNQRVIEQAMEILRRRIDPEGTREVTIQRQGDTRVIVEVPGVSDTQEIRRRIGTTAKMTFHLPHPSILNPTETTQPPPGYTLMKGAASMGEQGWYLVQTEAELDGTHLTDAQQTFQDGMPIIQFRFDTTGARIFCRITQENLKKPFAIVLDNEVISAPVIQSAICGGSGIIQGRFTVESATRLALLLRAGALPAKFNVAEERTVGATLGADAIEAGIWASMLGVALVAFYMISAYGLFGAFAIVALTFNLIILAAIMSALGATLTLPGIAGIVLSLGMSVDANVLIYERMREEIRAGRTTLSAIDAGFRRAFTAIADSNITSIIAGLLLYLFGSGPVKGFGVTLAIGVGASFFTAIMLTRIQVVYWWRWRRPKQLPIVRNTAVAAGA
ncbi:MAG: protein translocase subunit SecD [Candidatus Odyssella sp.]|nr:protein translocase subunit SecD [Candidatus Odyssella sp.]